MKKIALMIFTATFFGCLSGPDYKYNYNLVGYSKNNDARVITYNIENLKEINKDSFPTELITDLTLKGQRESNTSGRITAVFFFLDNEAPDITNLKTYDAIDKAHENKPVAAVWKYGDGTDKTIYLPE